MFRTKKKGKVRRSEADTGDSYDASNYGESTLNFVNAGKEVSLCSLLYWALRK